MKRVTIAALLMAAVVGTTGIVGLMGGRVTAAPVVETGKTGEVVVKWKLDSVTVYRGQALVTRVVDVPGAAGLGELVVSDLPERILPGSLFAEGIDGTGVEVRSVRYREQAVGDDVREEVRKLDAEIRKYGDKIAANAKQLQVLGEQRNYLEKLENFTAPTASTEMTKGVLNAEQLKTLTNYQFETRAKIADAELKLQQEQRDLREQMSVIERQRGEITGKSSRTVRQAVVFTSQEKAGGKLRVRYLVDAAGWSPSYNIRADAARKSAVVEYQASIVQMSGEDWNDVAMTLSTATPTLVAAAPQLNPLQIALASRGSADVMAGEMVSGRLDYKAAKQELYEQRKQAESSRGQFGAQGAWANANQPVGNTGNNVYSGSTTISGGNITVQSNSNWNRDNDLELNKVADQLQVLELLAKDSRKDEEERRVNGHEGIVVTYSMKSRTSLPSRSDTQLIQIDSMGMKSAFYKVAIPVLTNYVYDEATLTNDSKTVLLAGPVASYVGGQFVGNGEITTVAIGQNVTVGFGIDSSLRATRERIEKKEEPQQGNKVVNYTYKIAVENFGTVPANVRIMDRLPTSKDNEVRVTFVDDETVKLSIDKEYLQTERKKGLLRWDVTAPPEKNGSEAFSLTYKMNMEYDKNLGISASAGAKLQELEKTMKSR